MKFRLFIGWVSFCFLIVACEGTKETTKKSPRIKKATSVVSPKNGLKVKVGEILPIELKVNKEGLKVDSMLVSIGSQSKTKIVGISGNIETTEHRVGNQRLNIQVYFNNGTQEDHLRSVTLLSDVTPKEYTYRIVNTYVHDPDDFTQGLLIDDGVMYENTGQIAESKLKKINWETGKVIKSVKLEDEFFGEGIAIHNDKIYQLTWQARKGFIYDKNNLERIGEFRYNTEGWGLTTIENQLIMSDGTQNLYIMEPETFNELDHIQVYDQSGAIDSLNELEYIQGKIFTNRWGEDDIYIVDPSTGKVEGILDLTGIFNKSNYNRKIDVLNGIAYDHDNDKYYVTGKWWPKLFEIEIVEKKTNNI